jgi:hypothetical protein
LHRLAQICRLTVPCVGGILAKWLCRIAPGTLSRAFFYPSRSAGTGQSSGLNPNWFVRANFDHTAQFQSSHFALHHSLALSEVTIAVPRSRDEEMSEARSRRKSLILETSGVFFNRSNQMSNLHSLAQACTDLVIDDPVRRRHIGEMVMSNCARNPDRWPGAFDSSI